MTERHPLDLPDHHCVDDMRERGERWSDSDRIDALSEVLRNVHQSCDFILIDTPGGGSALNLFSHGLADTLITPVNDSFLDLDGIFRTTSGLVERVVYREFFPLGLTTFDSFETSLLGVKPSMSHVLARLEVRQLITALGLPIKAEDVPAAAAAGPDMEEPQDVTTMDGDLRQ